MVRLVRTENGVLVDETGKLNGRGAYLHAAQSCWKKGLKGSIARGLKTEISKDNLDELKQYMDSLPKELSKQEDHA